jgi:hypothetical protein
MQIGIVGAGYIGRTLGRELSRAGHDVSIANSRGPETIEKDALSTGARAVTAEAALAGAEVVILSIPFSSLPGFAATLSQAPSRAAVIDTSNYYPARDGQIVDIDGGKVESVWVQELLGRPVVKAWNAIGSASFATKGTASGTPGRIAIPVAADDGHARSLGMRLVEDTGFDAVDAGGLAESWRQQPGAPCYCTDLTFAQMPDALAAAEKHRLPRRRDLAAAAIAERLGGEAAKNPTPDYTVRLNRAIFT